MTHGKEAVPHDGMTYAQNYDVMTKWMADVLRGETLEVLGIKSGRITEVFGFEPVDITVTAERVDIMLRDEDDRLFHLEEQRNLQKADLYRFAAYHFLAAKQWGATLTDIILASGNVMVGKKELKTTSGTYQPVVIDFTQRDGERRLHEIREAVQAGTFTHWLELIFVPLYGRVTGMHRSALVEQVIRFEKELYHDNIISQRLIVATLIMSNKLVEKELLNTLWEEVKMLDILELAQEKGMEKGMVTAMQDFLLDTLIEVCGIGASVVATQIQQLTDPVVLKELHRQAVKCRDLNEFKSLLQQVSHS